MRLPLLKKLGKLIFSTSTRKNRLWSFIFSVGQFALLGLKQMAGYAGKLVLSKITGALATITEFFSIFKILKISGIKGWKRIFSFVFLFAGIISFIGVTILFQGSPFLGLDIHGAEYLARGFFVLSLVFAGADWLSVALGNYPGLFLHKLLVNKGSGLSLMDSQTDDTSGRTWSTKIFGKKISVPRMGQKMRLIVAVVSLGVAILHIYHNPNDKHERQKVEQPVPVFIEKA